MPNLRGKTWTTTTPANVEDAQYWEDHLISDTAAAKAASSVQSVNSITPDNSGNVDIVALPAGGTTGQVLTKISNTSGDADWLDPASSGHTIEDEDGTTMTQQPTLQFLNAEITNDSVNDKTIVDCKGSKGDPGTAATVAVGTVTTLPAGSSATVTNSGTSSAAVFNFGIPKGTDGTGSGDMTKADYDDDDTVITAGGIVDYVASAISGKADTSSLGAVATSNDYDDLDNKPTIPVITNTYSSSSSDGMSGIAVASAISGKLNGGVVATSTSADGTTVSFADIDTTKSYMLQADLPNNYNGAPVGMSNVQITNSGGVYSVTYTVTNASVGMGFDLVEIG